MAPRLTEVFKEAGGKVIKGPWKSGSPRVSGRSASFESEARKVMGEYPQAKDSKVDIASLAKQLDESWRYHGWDDHEDPQLRRELELVLDTLVKDLHRVAQGPMAEER